MNLYNHFAAVGFSNTYLLASGDEGDALLVDPGKMDVPLLKLIEDNNYYIRDILITHSHCNHYGGVKTLLKLYDANVYSAVPDLNGTPSRILEEGNYSICGFDIEVIPVLGHTDDSLVYRVGEFYFTGDILSAGRTGTTPDDVTRDVLFLELEQKIFSRDSHGVLLPGHGPPSTIKAEKALFASNEKSVL